MKKIDRPDERDLELQRDAIALFQTADDLYMNRRYRVDATRATTEFKPQTNAAERR
jgi:hypothetical protein